MRSPCRTTLICRSGITAFAALLPVLASPQGAPASSGARGGTAGEIVAAAAVHLGGFDALRGVRTLRMQYVTHWFRFNFVPSASGMASAGSLELNVDTRDYERPAWRQFRGSIAGGANGPGVAVIVTDSVAVSHTPRGWLLLNGSYLDERAELFLMAPERLIPALDSLARAGRLGAPRDTVLNGVALRGVRGMLGGREVTLWVDAAGFPAGARIHAAQPLDFGLAGFGAMDIDVWFAQWRFVSGVAFPGHVRVLRMGQPYKELFVQSVVANGPAPADSFAVSDSLRRVFAAEGGKATFDIPIPAVRPDSTGIVTFGPAQVMQGAVRLKSGWLVLGTGADSLVVRRALEALGSDKGAAVVIGATVASTGGAPAADRRGLDVYVPRAAEALTRRMYRQQGARPARLKPIGAGAWTQVAGDSVWMESLTVPDVPGAVLVWVPRLSWAYVGPVAGALQFRAALAALDRRGFAPARIGTLQSLSRSTADLRREAGGPPRP